MVSSNKSPHIIHFDSILIFRLMVFCEMGLCIAQHRINSVKAIFFLSIHIQVNSLHSFFSIGFCCSMPGIFLSFLCSLLGRLSVLMFVVLCGFGMVFPFAFHFCSTYFGCASVSIYLYSLVFIFISLTLFGFYFFSGGRGGGYISWKPFDSDDSHPLFVIVVCSFSPTFSPLPISFVLLLSQQKKNKHSNSG